MCSPHDPVACTGRGIQKPDLFTHWRKQCCPTPAGSATDQDKDNEGRSQKQYYLTSKRAQQIALNMQAIPTACFMLPHFSGFAVLRSGILASPCSGLSPQAATKPQREHLAMYRVLQRVKLCRECSANPSFWHIKLQNALQARIPLLFPCLIAEMGGWQLWKQVESLIFKNHLDAPEFIRLQSLQAF